MSTTLRVGTLGTCPVCEGEYKVKGGVLVHHGYRRPGDGAISNDGRRIGSLLSRY